MISSVVALVQATRSGADKRERAPKIVVGNMVKRFSDHLKRWPVEAEKFGHYLPGADS
jgi:hypothetical protein